MTSPRQSLRALWTEPPRPWHLLLTPAIPLLGLLKDSLWMTPATAVVGPLLVAVAIAALLAIVLVPLGADRHRTALAISMLMLTGLSYLMVALPVDAFAGTTAVVVMYVIVALAAVKLILTSGSAAILTVIANRTVTIAVLLLVLPIVWSELRRPGTAVPPFTVPTAASDHPDVYVIVLDGYARQDVLREGFGFDNNLIPDLRASGFFVADRAAANYSQTALSLASALNADYMQALNPAIRYGTDRRGLGDLINDSRFFRAFVNVGYRVRAYSSEYALIHPQGVHERPSPVFYLTDFGYTVYETTIVPAVLNAAGFQRGALPMHFHRRHIKWTLSDFAQREPATPQPELVFAHILAPHPPFAFDANGGPRQTSMPALLRDGDHWHRLTASATDSYEGGYVDTVRTLNTHLVAAVKSIASRSRKSIILIHGDHGPGAGLVWDRPDRTDIRERLSILAALRFPDGEVPPVTPDSTPVNLYRAVLNRALGIGLPAIEDRSFHSTWERPFDFIEVTGRLNGAGTGTATSPH